MHWPPHDEKDVILIPAAPEGAAVYTAALADALAPLLLSGATAPGL